MPYLEREHTRIWWESMGSGTPVLILQGLGYPSDASWRLLPELSARHTVLMVDNRGVGRSDVPPEPFTIEDLAADAAAVIAAAGFSRSHLLGLSMGGLIAQELALRRPATVQALILGCTSPGGLDAVPVSERAAAMLARLTCLPARQAAEAAAEIVYCGATPISEVAADIEVRMARPTSRAGYLAQLSSGSRYRGSLSRLAQLKAPTLILHGSADQLVDPANAHLLHSAIAGAELQIFDGAGHIFTTDARGESIKAIIGFLAAHESVTRAVGAQEPGDPK